MMKNLTRMVVCATLLTVGVAKADFVNTWTVGQVVNGAQGDVAAVVTTYTNDANFSSIQSVQLAPGWSGNVIKNGGEIIQIDFLNFNRNCSVTFKAAILPGKVKADLGSNYRCR